MVSPFPRRLTTLHSGLEDRGAPEDRSPAPSTDCEHECWDWLWRNTRYSQAEIAKRSGIRGESPERKMQILIANRACSHSDFSDILCSVIESHLQDVSTAVRSQRRVQARCQASPGTLGWASIGFPHLCFSTIPA